MYKNCIRVYCRLKPNFDENPQNCIKYQICPCINEENEYEILIIRGKNSVDFINNKPDAYSFRFQNVFNEETNQKEIYDVVAKPVIEGVMQGFNGTIFAYGQTGSGKTFTISGITEEQSTEAIVHRSMKQMFQSLNQIASNNYFIDVSYMEIYNENGCDLLSEKDDRRIVIQEDEDSEIQLKNLSMHHVRNYEEFLELYRTGENNRSESSTNLNQYSSRSHCILTFYVAMKIPNSQHYQRSKLHLVDLAGSERISKIGSPYQTLPETRNINLSLHYLEQVIVALGEKHRLHIPYRNSLMTTLLRDSLGGNCRTTMIATLSTHINNLSETLTTCRFAQRVALVKNEVSKNLCDDSVEIDIMKSEFQSLKNQMSETSFKTALSGFKNIVNQNLSEEESLECQNFVDNFISGRNSYSKVITPVIQNPDKIRTCFELLKSVIIDMQQKRKKAEQQAHFMYRRVLESKQDKGILKSTKSCILPNNSLCPKSSENSFSEYTSTNSISEASESLLGHESSQKFAEMKKLESCAHHKCVPSEVFEAKMNTLVNVIEECKEIHKKELSKLESIKTLVVNDITINHQNLSGIIKKMNEEKFSKLGITKTKSLSSFHNTGNDDKSHSQDYNKEILLTFDASNKYMKSHSNDSVSEDNRYDTKLRNTEKSNVGFKCHFRNPQVKAQESSQSEDNKYDTKLRSTEKSNVGFEYYFRNPQVKPQESSQTIITERKNLTSILKQSQLPKYIRKNPNCCNDKLNTISEPIMRCHDMNDHVSDQDKNSHIRLNTGHKSQQCMTTKTLLTTKKRGKFNTRKSSPKRSIFTKHRLELKEDTDYRNTVSVSHYEGDSLLEKCCTDGKKKYDNLPTDGNTIEFENCRMNDFTEAINSSQYIPTSSEEYCVRNAVKNWRSLNESQNCCFTYISDSETEDEKKFINDNDNKTLTNQFSNIADITTNQSNNKIIENCDNLLNRLQHCNFNSNKSYHQSKAMNYQDKNKVLLNSKLNKTFFQLDEELFSNLETDVDNFVYNVSNPNKMDLKFNLSESTDDSFNIESSILNVNNATQKADEKLPLTGDPDVDEEIARFYQKKFKYYT